jgi:fatty-acyl-CoA synthase
MIQKLVSWLGPSFFVTLAHRLMPEREYIIFHEQRLTRRQVFDNIKRLAAGLQAMGLQKGDRIVTLLPACPAAVYALFLPSTLGTVEVPLNPLLREHELRYILADCGAKAVITTQSWYGQDYAAMLARLRPDLPGLRAVIVQGAAHSDDGGVFFSLEQVMDSGRPLRQVSLLSHEVNRIAYTSGTTGRPKGVVHTRARSWGLLHPAALAHLKSLRCLLLPFPPCYYSGQLGIVSTLLSGGKVVLMDRFNPNQALEVIERERVTQIAASPTMYRLLLRAPGQADRDLSSVQRILFATEACPPDLARALYERFKCSLENVYGASETGNISWSGMDDSWERAATSVGKPVPGARVRIVDDARRPLPTGQPGEIAVQTAQMMEGYYNDPELTAQVLDAKGWFYTGDTGYVDQEGYLHLAGRKKDVIIRGGQKIYPEEVEQYLEQHPAIRRAGVVSLPSELAGETVWAFLESQPGASLTAQAALDFCRGQIAPFKIPDHVRFMERLPVTFSDKVQRFKLREMAMGETANNK